MIQSLSPLPRVARAPQMPAVALPRQDRVLPVIALAFTTLLIPLAVLVLAAAASPFLWAAAPSVAVPVTGLLAVILASCVMGLLGGPALLRGVRAGLNTRAATDRQMLWSLAAFAMTTSVFMVTMLVNKITCAG